MKWGRSREPGPLEGKRVVLGVCGGIAAYKAVEVCRRLGDAGALVSPVLTRSATRFVGALTFSALAAEPARISLFTSEDEGASAGTGVGASASSGSVGGSGFAHPACRAGPEGGRRS